MSETAKADLLGEVVAWDVKAPETPVELIRDALSDVGLPTDVAGELTAAGTFSRAMKSMKENRLIEKVSSKNGVTLFQLTQESNDGQRIDHVYEAVLSLDTETGAISCSDDPSLAVIVQGLFNEAGQIRNSSDITKMVQNLFADNADLYPLNSKGVAYFVPIRFADFLDKVELFLNRVGGQFSRFPVPEGTRQGNQSVQEAVSAGLQTLIDELDAAVAEYDGSTRADTLDRTAQRLATIEYKIDAYTQYLGDKQSALQEEFAAAKLRFKEKSLGIDAERAERKAALKAEREAAKASTYELDNTIADAAAAELMTA